MKKKQEQNTKTCADCIHETACRMWTDGRPISDSSASLCPNYTTVKDSGAYLCGVLDERKRKQTNADRIRAEIANDEGLADLLVHWLDDWGEYSTPIGHIENYEEAISKTVEWLKQTAEGDVNNG